MWICSLYFKGRWNGEDNGQCVSVDPFEGKVYLTDLLGEQKIVDGEIKEIRLMDHKIIIKENK